MVNDVTNVKLIMHLFYLTYMIMVEMILCGTYESFIRFLRFIIHVYMCLGLFQPSCPKHIRNEACPGYMAMMQSHKNNMI